MEYITPIRSFYLPSGRVIVSKLQDGTLIESTEMRDVTLDGKAHQIVRETNDPNVIWEHLAPVDKKWLLTVSTQKGCCHKCKFCDVAPLGFHGNLTAGEILAQIKMLIESTPEIKAGGTTKAKIGFARMGEPAHNIVNVQAAMSLLKTDEYTLNGKIKWLPCFNTIMPRTTYEGYSWEKVVDSIIFLKESLFDGFMHVQISCNSTDEAKRKELFNGANVASVKEIIECINKYNIKNRTITLNFISMEGVEFDAKKLIDWGLNKEKFAVKLIPLNKTINATDNGLKTVYNYSNYDELKKQEDILRNEGIPIVTDAIAKCEEAGLCCGQLLRKYYI